MYQRLELGGLVVFESQCTGCGIPYVLIRWQKDDACVWFFPTISTLSSLQCFNMKDIWDA